MAAGDITAIESDIQGTQNVEYGTIELPASYAAGGPALGTAKFGLTTVNFVQFEQPAGYVFGYDRTNDKVKVFYGNYDGSDGPLIEVADTTNVAALVCRFRAEGRK